MPTSALNIAQEFLAKHSTLHAAIQAGVTIVDVVILDEYSHDVVARLPPTFGEHLVVFGST